MKTLEEMTDPEIVLNGRAAGLLLMHVLPAYCALCGSYEEAISRINELLDTSRKERLPQQDFEQLLDYMDEIDFKKQPRYLR